MTNDAGESCGLKIPDGVTGAYGTYILEKFSNLTNLRSLLLAGHPNLTGEIPSQIGNLINLEELALKKNSLTGEIPGSIGNLTNLRELDLSENNFTGLGKCIVDCGWSNLKWVKIGGNHKLESSDFQNLANLIKNNAAKVSIANGSVESVDTLNYFAGKVASIDISYNPIENLDGLDSDLEVIGANKKFNTEESLEFQEIFNGKPVVKVRISQNKNYEDPMSYEVFCGTQNGSDDSF